MTQICIIGYLSNSYHKFLLNNAVEKQFLLKNAVEKVEFLTASKARLARIPICLLVDTPQITCFIVASDLVFVALLEGLLMWQTLSKLRNHR